jgi:uncharacterized protein (TIGR02266 family)
VSGDDKLARRESPRVAASFRVRYPTLDKLVVAYSEDLSNGGMFLGTKKFLPLNAVVRLQLELPEGGGELSVIARVVFVRDEAQAQKTAKSPGMGVQFLDLVGENSKKIEEFIAKRTLEQAPESSGPKQPTGPIKVVVVDDDPNYRELAAGHFRARGDHVRIASDGFEGLAACLKEPPDIILSDVQMPRMDGWQLLRMVRARPSLAATPVIFLTTLSGEAERLRGYQLGVDDYLGKPYRPEELEMRVIRIVARAQKAGGADRKTLRGDLEQVPLASVLSFLENERKTGQLLILGERSVRIFLRDGRPLRIEVGDPPIARPPLELMYEVLGWTSGQFEFAAQDVACEDEIRSTSTALLLEHARVMDERNR